MRSVVSILTQRISYMTEHLRAHPKDKHSRLGLMAMLSHRKKLLQYLRRTDGDRYQKLISGLGLKDIQGGER
jgi:small subunit ribosomal protein S15